MLIPPSWLSEKRLNDYTLFLTYLMHPKYKTHPRNLHVPVVGLLAFFGLIPFWTFKKDHDNIFKWLPTCKHKHDADKKLTISALGRGSFSIFLMGFLFWLTFTPRLLLLRIKHHCSRTFSVISLFSIITCSIHTWRQSPCFLHFSF